MDLGHVQDYVVKVVNQVEPEKLLQKRVFKLGKQVYIALLAVPSF
jgi:hypothetical protein